MPQMFVLPRQLAISSTNQLLSGALAYFYATGTTNPQAVYYDIALTIEAPNPLPATASGEFPKVYYNPNAAANYRVKYTTAAGVLIYQEDDISRYPASQEEIGAALYPKTDAEIAAGVTPVNYAYAFGNVLRYGNNTVPGTTDMTSAIQAAVDALPSAGGEVWFPAGDYRVSGNILITNSGTWLRGEGPYTSKIVGDIAMTEHIVTFDSVGGPPSGAHNLGIIWNIGGNPNYDCLHLDGPNGFILSKLWLSGGRRNLHINDGSDILLSDIVSELSYGANYYITASILVRASNMISYRSEGVGYHLQTSLAVTSTDHETTVQLSNCSDYESLSYGFFLEDYKDVQISNCAAGAQNTQRPIIGVLVDGCSRIQLDNVSVVHSQYEGIQVLGSTDVRISNPLIDAVGNFSSLGTTASYGIVGSGSTRLSVLGGQITNCAGNGVLFFNSNGKLIGLDIINPAQKASANNGLTGIIIAGTNSDNVTIDACDVIGSSVASSVGIDVQTDCVVQGANNRVSGFTTLFQSSGGYVHRYLSGIGINDTPQTITGDGAVSLTTELTYLVTTGANALTLADGYVNQHKFIVMKTDGGDGTLTPTNLYNGTTLTFNDVGDSAHLIFMDGQWVFMGGTATLA